MKNNIYTREEQNTEENDYNHTCSPIHSINNLYTLTQTTTTTTTTKISISIKLHQFLLCRLQI